MPTAIVTGSGGLIGSESVSHLVRDKGFEVIGLENDMRAQFFGADASTAGTTQRLVGELDGFRSESIDIRDADAVGRLFRSHAKDIAIVIHTAAQPSHDWAAKDPQTDFTVNANGTLNLLEAARHNCPDATFIFTSTNKVYGDKPNFLPLEDIGSRVELPEDHEYFKGIPTSMSIDYCMHSIFGASKVAADVMVQEYGRYFDMPTVCFRCGCLTGPSHAGAQLHGFLSYLMKCTVTGAGYTIFGYQGKQVRDNMHSADVFEACWRFHEGPRAGSVYNLGGGRRSNCSMLEAIKQCEQIAGTNLKCELSNTERKGDHRWWISDLSAFQSDYPGFEPKYDVNAVLQEIYDGNAEHWLGAGK